MLEAKSMYHGGELVSAIDVNLDFDSYKELGLLCPFCSEPVFLCGETVRQSNKTGKLSYIQPHFKHFAGGDPMELTCEKRYYTAEGKRHLDAMRSERRGQRLDLFNRYCWEMVRDGGLKPFDPSFNENFNPIKRLSRFVDINDWYLQARQLQHNLRTAEDSVWVSKIEEVFEDFFTESQWKDNLYSDQPQELREFRRSQTVGRMNFIRDVSDLKIQKLVVFEVLTFLLSKPGTQAFRNLMAATCLVEIFESGTLNMTMKHVSGIILATLALTSWQQQLEEKANLKERSRAKGFRKSA